MAAESRYVFDSSAILALLLDERGAGKIAPHAQGAAVSSITLGETATKLVRRYGGPSTVRQQLGALHLDLVPWTEELVWQGLDLCPLAWTHGLSLADRACLTLARALGRTALTADKAWLRAAKDTHLKLAVELFR